MPCRIITVSRSGVEKSQIAEREGSITSSHLDELLSVAGHVEEEVVHDGRADAREPGRFDHYRSSFH